MKGLLGTARHTLVLSWRADRWATVLTMFLAVAAAGTVAGTGLSQRWVIEGSPAGLSWQTWQAIVLGVFAYTLSSVVLRIQDNLQIDLSQRVELELSQEILRTTASIPTVEHLDRAEYQDRIVLLRQGAGSLAASGWSMAESASALVSVGLSLWLLASVHPWLSLLAVACLPVLALARHSADLAGAATDRTAEGFRLERELHELCLRPENAKELYIAGNGAEIGRRAENLGLQVTRTRAAAMMRGAAWESLGWIVYGAGLVAALMITVRLIDDQRAGIGDVVLLTTVASQLRMQIGQTVYGLSRIAEAGRLVRHYRWLGEFARSQPVATGAPTARLDDGIRLDRVSFRYPGSDTWVLREVSLHLPAGSTAALVGINGAGKTTLVKLLLGMIRPTSGTITVDGVPLSDLAAAEWARRCTATFQDFAKLQFLAGETVGVGDPAGLADTDRIGRAVTGAGADKTVNSLPQGLQTQLGALFNGAELSRGQWQRLALARGLMPEEPLLVVLDEPTAALDPQAEHELFQRFEAQVRKVAGQAITVLVSHRFSTVHQANQILVLNDGRITERGTHQALMKQDGQYARLYATQAQGYVTA